MRRRKCRWALPYIVNTRRAKTTTLGKRTGQTKARKVIVKYRRQKRVRKICKPRILTEDEESYSSSSSGESELTEMPDVWTTDSYGNIFIPEDGMLKMYDLKDVGEEKLKEWKVETQTPTESNENKIGLQFQEKSESEDDEDKQQVGSSLHNEDKKYLPLGKRTGRTKRIKVTVTYRRKRQVKKICKPRTRTVDSKSSSSTESSDESEVGVGELELELPGHTSNPEDGEINTDSKVFGENTTKELKLETQTPIESNQNKIGLQLLMDKDIKSNDTGKDGTSTSHEAIISSGPGTSARDTKFKAVRRTISEFFHRGQENRSNDQPDSIMTQEFSSVPNLAAKSSLNFLDWRSQQWYLHCKENVITAFDRLKGKGKKPDADRKENEKWMMKIVTSEVEWKKRRKRFPGKPPGLSTIVEDKEPVPVCPLQLRPKCSSEGSPKKVSLAKPAKPTYAESYPGDKATKRCEQDEKVENFFSSSNKETNQRRLLLSSKNTLKPDPKYKSGKNKSRDSSQSFMNKFRRIRFSGGNRVLSEVLSPVPTQSDSSAFEAEDSVPPGPGASKLKEKVKKDKIPKNSTPGCFSFFTGKVGASRSAIRSLWSRVSFRNRTPKVESSDSLVIASPSGTNAAESEPMDLMKELDFWEKRLKQNKRGCKCW